VTSVDDDQQMAARSDGRKRGKAVARLTGGRTVKRRAWG
jgi:hypothetical protein